MIKIDELPRLIGRKIIVQKKGKNMKLHGVLKIVEEDHIEILGSRRRGVIITINSIESVRLSKRSNAEKKWGDLGIKKKCVYVPHLFNE